MKSERHSDSEDQNECVLLVDDSPLNLKVLRRTLEETGYNLITANNGFEAIAAARESQPILILLDIVMPGIDGFETCKRLRSDPVTARSAVMFLSTLDEIENKVRGFEHGAVDYITKPFRKSEIIARVKTHMTLNRLQNKLQAQNKQLEHELQVAQELLDEADRRLLGPLLGQSDAVRDLRDDIKAAANRRDSILLAGPLGTGAESVARAIHRQSNLTLRAFICVNCMTVREDGEAAFFGTFAASEKSTDDMSLSKFDLARGGTLFLDEVAELPKIYQSRLCEVLRELKGAHGKNSHDKSDVRVIAYTSRNLLDAVRDKRFDAMLYHVLNRRCINLPPLLNRTADLEVLIDYFIQQQARRLGKVIAGFSKESMARLHEYHWPGNIKELKGLIERIVILSTTAVLELEEGSLEHTRSLGGYDLVYKLNSGGMGEVWLAKHRLLTRPAAVKLIRSDVTDIERKQQLFLRFEQEAKSTANLQSPNTVTLFDYGLSGDGDFYYVMEYLSGFDLEAMVTHYETPHIDRVVWFMLQACRSLVEAHNSELVHRDIKPGNLFVCRLGNEFDVLKVLDFGIVKSSVDEVEVVEGTNKNYCLGTPGYMAPEAIMGKADLDGKADVYSLGCVAYRLLAGREVFSSSITMQVFYRHLKVSPEPLAKAAKVYIPERFDKLISKCLEKNPENRYSAEELIVQLEEMYYANPWDRARAEKWWRDHLPHLHKDPEVSSKNQLQTLADRHDLTTQTHQTLFPE
jgi:DNA-binding NtrC family response regulator